MSTPEYPESMPDPDTGPERSVMRDRSEWLWSVVFVTAAFGFGDLRRDQPVLTATVPGLIFGAVFLGAVAILVGRDGRERWAGVLSPVPVLAVGLLAIWLLSPGWALATVIAAMAAVAGPFVAWHKRRTPAPRTRPPAAQSEISPPATQPKRPPVAGRCRWCGQRPVAVVCGGRADGGRCEMAEAAASDLADRR